MAKFFILNATRELVLHSFEADTRRAALREAIRYLTHEGLPVVGEPTDQFVLAKTVDGFNYMSRDLWAVNLLLAFESCAESE